MTRHRDAATLLLLAAASLLLALGLTLPAFTVERLWVFESSRSIGGVVWTLLTGADLALGAVIGAFSILLPAAKLALSFWVWAAPAPGGPAVRRALAWSVRLGRWSMMDVFLVALLVAMVFSLGVVRFSAGAGVYCFCAAIACSMVAAHRLQRRLDAPAARAG